MFKNLGYFAVLSVVLQAIFAQENGLQTDTKHSKEKLSVAVKIIEKEDGENGFTEVLVCLLYNI